MFNLSFDIFLIVILTFEPISPISIYTLEFSNAYFEMFTNKFSITLYRYLLSAFINISSLEVEVITSKCLAKNLSSNSPTDCFISSTVFILSKFNFTFPEEALEASTKSSVNFFNL